MVAEVRRSWIVGRFDRVSTVGADGGGIDVPCAWKLGHDPVLGAALADEPAELRLLGLPPRAQRPRLLFGHAHYLLRACGYNARQGRSSIAREPAANAGLVSPADRGVGTQPPPSPPPTPPRPPPPGALVQGSRRAASS